MTEEPEGSYVVPVCCKNETASGEFEPMPSASAIVHPDGTVLVHAPSPVSREVLEYLSEGGGQFFYIPLSLRLKLRA